MDGQAIIEPGAVIAGLYEVRRRIGAGGMSEVFEAWHAESGRAVAVKIIAIEGEDPRVLRRRFFNELLLATRVKHPNIVAVHDFGTLEASGHPYLVMEVLRGMTLKRYLRRVAALEVPRALRLFLGVLRALGAAHAQGVVHKDLKPENLFLTDIGGPDESLVVLDFGIAHRVRGSGAQPSEYTGTPRYLAPEYLLGKVVGPSIDVYQVGLTLCEALTRRPVVDVADAGAAVRVHTSGLVRPPPSLRDGALGELLSRALAFDPAERFADAGAFADAVAALIGAGVDEGVRRTQPPAPPRTRGGPGAAPALGVPTEGGSDEDLQQTQLLDASDRADLDATVLLDPPIACAPGTPVPAVREPPPPLAGPRRHRAALAALGALATVALLYAWIGG